MQLQIAYWEGLTSPPSFRYIPCTSQLPTRCSWFCRGPWFSHQSTVLMALPMRPPICVQVTSSCRLIWAPHTCSSLMSSIPFLHGCGLLFSTSRLMYVGVRHHQSMMQNGYVRPDETSLQSLLGLRSKPEAVPLKSIRHMCNGRELLFRHLGICAGVILLKLVRSKFICHNHSSHRCIFWVLRPKY